MLYKTAQETYFDAKGIVDFYTKLGKTATADFFRSINEKDTDIVRHGRITWIPESFVRRWCELSSVGPDFAVERFKEIQSHVIQWLPMQEDTTSGIQQSYERAQKIN
jgi:hypothetical protein